jgi:predicted Zn-dependent protease
VKESAVTPLEGELDGHTKQLKDLQEKLEALSQPAPPLDLGSLNGKIAGLAKSVDAVAPLPEQVTALDAKVGGIDKSLKALQDGLAGLNAQIATLKGDLKKYRGSAESADKPVDVNVADQAMSQAVELFKAGRYKEAVDVFKTVEDNDPKDARVWYYAAMSRGMATNDWRGETERLVKKGVEREKAGTPRIAEIDAEFATLAPPTLKSWLEFYRKTAK